MVYSTTAVHIMPRRIDSDYLPVVILAQAALAVRFLHVMSLPFSQILDFQIGKSPAAIPGDQFLDLNK